MMKRKELERHLQDVDGFEKPKVLLEQYETGAHIGASMLHTIESAYGDICGRSVLDLGCGCSVLSIGAALLGASYVLGVDVDEDALQIAAANVSQSELTNIDLIQCDLDGVADALAGRPGFDTVVMNPPFGTKHNKGLDVRFVETALQCVTDKGVVYSLHKTSTRDFFQRKAPAWNVEAQVVAQLRYDLPRSYRFHTKASVDIHVDFWRFAKISNNK